MRDCPYRTQSKLESIRVRMRVRPAFSPVARVEVRVVLPATFTRDFLLSDDVLETFICRLGCEPWASY